MTDELRGQLLVIRDKRVQYAIIGESAVAGASLLGACSRSGVACFTTFLAQRGVPQNASDTTEICYGIYIK